MAVQTTLVVAEFLCLDGEPCSGTVTFTPPCIVRDNAGGAVLSGPISEDLNSYGFVAFRVPCTEQDDLSPMDWCYTVTVRLDCTPCVEQFEAHVPCGIAITPLADLAANRTDGGTMTDDCCGTVVLRGPKGDPGEPGPPGETEIRVTDPITADGTGTEGDPYVLGLYLSEEPDNNLTLAVDGGLYSPVPDGSETIVTPGGGISVAGTGTADDPYIITSTVSAESLGAITSVTGTDGVTATQSGTEVTVSADISATDGNQLALDATDGGLYVAAQTSVGDNTYVIGQGLEQSGSGTAEDPYVLSVDVSADAGNAIVYGTDGGLYVADVPAGVTSVTAADSTVTVDPTSGDVTVAANVSADADNALTTGADGGLYVNVPEPYDSGLQTDITLADGFTTLNDLGYYIEGNRVFFSGGIRNTSGTTPTNTIMGTVPAAARPMKNVATAVAAGSGYTSYVNILADTGEIQFVRNTGLPAAGSWVNLEGVNYRRQEAS